MIMLYIEEMNILYIGQFLRGVVFSFVLHIFFLHVINCSDKLKPRKKLVLSNILRVNYEVL